MWVNLYLKYIGMHLIQRIEKLFQFIKEYTCPKYVGGHISWQIDVKFGELTKLNGQALFSGAQYLFTPKSYNIYTVEIMQPDAILKVV